MKVYAGIDPVTKKEYHLTEVVPAGPQAAAEAEKVRTKLLNQLDERRAPKTRATVSQLLTKHFELLKVESNTLDGYESLARNHGPGSGEPLHIGHRERQPEHDPGPAQPVHLRPDPLDSQCDHVRVVLPPAYFRRLGCLGGKPLCAGRGGWPPGGGHPFQPSEFFHRFRHRRPPPWCLVVSIDVTVRARVST